jgi:hypothetical protein
MLFSSAHLAVALAEPEGPVDADVALAFKQWLHHPTHDLLTDLIRLADERDQRLCSTWSTGCWTPHDLVREPCCGTWVCGEHEQAHDASPAAGGCREYDALLREEAF